MCRIQSLLVGLATLGILCGPVGAVDPQVGAAVLDGKSESLLDVALDQAGVLRARILDAASNPLANRAVEIVKNGQVIANAETDEHGRLAIPGLNGGVYQLRTAKTTCVFRVWTNEAAPPSAVSLVAVTEVGLIVRGQGACDCGQCATCVAAPAAVGFAPAEPVMIAALLAAAIAVPIAVHNSGGDSPPGS